MNKEKYSICDNPETFIASGKCLILHGPWQDNFRWIVEKENISSLRISRANGWKGEDISFLTSVPQLQGLEIYDWDVKDLTPLNKLTNLRSLGIQCQFTKAPEFTSFSKLKKLSLFWRPKASDVFSCTTLMQLNIVNFPFQNLEKIMELKLLERLQLSSRKLIDLNGIENLHNLVELDIANSPKLECLLKLDECKLLESVIFNSCKKISDLSALGALPKLKKAHFIDCGKIKSLEPLVNSNLLEEIIFTGDTIIEDGNISPLTSITQIKKAALAKRRHYTHTADEVIS